MAGRGAGWVSIPSKPQLCNSRGRPHMSRTMRLILAGLLVLTAGTVGLLVFVDWADREADTDYFHSLKVEKDGEPGPPPPGVIAWYSR